VLDSLPYNPVIISVTSFDVGEGTVSLSSVDFSISNWDTPQVVTVVGADDVEVDGDVLYLIDTGAFVSSDSNFHNAAVANVAITNTDRKCFDV
jgi:hypothetical protein